MILKWINPRRFYLRWPLKMFLFGVITLLVLFPRLDRLWITIPRWLNPESLVNPNSPALQPLVSEFDSIRQPDWDRPRLAQEIQYFVYRKVPYDWDWNIWGNADYFPTVEEVMTQKREDCDGRAIVAASLLRRYGIKAWLVLGGGHAWVKTDVGEVMGPASRKAVEVTEQGPQVNWSYLWQLYKDIAMGISVFLLPRELILVCAFWILMMSRSLRIRDTLVWLAVLTVGLMLIRESGYPYREAISEMWWGYGLWIFVVVGMIIHSKLTIRGVQETPSP